MQYIRDLIKKLINPMLDALAVQALMSAAALVILIRFGYPIWPLMIVGTWMWGPCAGIALIGALILTPLSWLAALTGSWWFTPLVAGYERALLAWLDVLVYLGQGTSAQALVWPGYGLSFLLVSGAFVLYKVTLTLPGSGAVRVGMLWLWIITWVYGVSYVRYTDSFVYTWTDTCLAGVTVCIEPEGASLYDPCGVLARSRVRITRLHTELSRLLVSHGHTHIRKLYALRITPGVKRKMGMLARRVGAPEPEYRVMGDCKKEMPILDCQEHI